MGGYDYVESAGLLFERLMTEKLSGYELRRFPYSWMHEAVLRYVHEAHEKELKVKSFGAEDALRREKEALPDPPWGRVRFITDYIEHIDPKPTCTLPTVQKYYVDEVMERYGPPSDPVFYTAPGTNDVRELEAEIKKEEFVALTKLIIQISMVNERNNMGRTPMHLAMDPPGGVILAGHREVVQCLMDEHGAYVNPKDNFSKDVQHYINRGDKDGDMDEEARAIMMTEEERRASDERREKIASGKALVSGMTKKDWDILAADADELRAMSGWTELQSSLNGALFYRNDHGGQFQWEKPKALSQGDSRRQGWAMLKSRGRSLRVVGAWEEIEDPETGAAFWYNSTSLESQWGVPYEVQMHDDQEDRASEEGVLYREDGGRSEIDENAIVVGSETDLHQKKDSHTTANEEEGKGADNEKVVQGAHFSKEAAPLFGKSSEEKDDRSEETSGMNRSTMLKLAVVKAVMSRIKKGKKGWALLRAMGTSDWRSLAKNSKSLRKIANTGWEELRDEKSGSTFYFNKYLKTSQWEKPEAVEEHDRKKYDWHR